MRATLITAAAAAALAGCATPYDRQEIEAVPFHSRTLSPRHVSWFETVGNCTALDKRLAAASISTAMVTGSTPVICMDEKSWSA